MILKNWLTNINLVWQWVPGIAGHFDKVEQKVKQEKTNKYTPANISAAM